jgi:hypothetical protein
MKTVADADADSVAEEDLVTEEDSVTMKTWSRKKTHGTVGWIPVKTAVSA